MNAFCKIISTSIQAIAYISYLSSKKKLIFLYINDYQIDILYI